jgi:hypothetical protein
LEALMPLQPASANSVAQAVSRNNLPFDFTQQAV